MAISPFLKKISKTWYLFLSSTSASSQRHARCISKNISPSKSVQYPPSALTKPSWQTQSLIREFQRFCVQILGRSRSKNCHQVPTVFHDLWDLQYHLWEEQWIIRAKIKQWDQGNCLTRSSRREPLISSGKRIHRDKTENIRLTTIFNFNMSPSSFTIISSPFSNLSSILT